MENNIVIRATNLHKKFLFFKKDFKILRWLITKKGYDKEFHVLKGLNFEIKKGESVGVLGINGAGKSTLLKIISQVYYPSYGEVEVEGKISSLLELGAGFNGHLTGRENIFLKGTYLGMERKEVEKIIDDIIDFAELGDFIDMPFSSYSSGMRARLGFAMAINIDPDILIIDEVFAVGDKNFQVKSRAKTIEFFEQGKTILFVSHSEQLIKEFCNRAIYLKDGHIEYDGEVDKAIHMYNVDMKKSRYVPKFFYKDSHIEEDFLTVEFNYGIGHNRTIHEPLIIEDYEFAIERYSEAPQTNNFIHLDYKYDNTYDGKIFKVKINLKDIEEDINFRIKLLETKWMTYNFMYGFETDDFDKINKELSNYGLEMISDTRAMLAIRHK